MLIPENFTPKFFSLLRSGYDWQTLRCDMMAGLTVAIVALPLAMAIAIASGASPDKGLVTAVVAGFLISLLGGSRVQIGGPTGAFIVVVFNVIAVHGYDGLLLATLMAGVILVVAGYAKFGQVIRYIPYPVVTGFTAGIAVIIATSQVKDFFGLAIQNVPAEFIPRWAAYVAAVDTIDPLTMSVGIVTLVIILLLKYKAPKLPGNLIAVAVVSLAVLIWNFPVETIASRFPNIPSGLPMPSFPKWSFEKILEVTPSAFTIAFLAGIESLLSAVVADGMTGYRHRSSQELIGQGIANLASAFFGGLPATGAIARTATNVKSGAKTPMAGIFHALFILVFISAFTGIMAFVPLSALSAILFIVAWNMSERHHFILIFKISSGDRLSMLLTFGLTVLVDLTVAIGIGVTLASLQFMHEMSKSGAMRSQGRRVRDVDINTQEEENQRDDLVEGVEVFRFTGPVFFGMAGMLSENLQALTSFPKVLIIRMKLVPYIDVAGAKVIEALVKNYRAKGTILIFTGLQSQPREILAKVGIMDNQINLRLLDSYENAVSIAENLIRDGKAGS